MIHIIEKDNVCITGKLEYIHGESENKVWGIGDIKKLIFDKRIYDYLREDIVKENEDLKKEIEKLKEENEELRKVDTEFFQSSSQNKILEEKIQILNKRTTANEIAFLLLEEMGELIQAITKMWRTDIDIPYDEYMENIEEETADVLLTLTRFIKHQNMTNINERMSGKLDRVMERINSK